VGVHRSVRGAREGFDDYTWCQYLAWRVLCIMDVSSVRGFMYQPVAEGRDLFDTTSCHLVGS